MSGGLSASDVNSNIPLEAGAGVPQFNPLQQVGQFADTANALNQLKLFPGQQALQQQAITSGNLGIQSAKTSLAEQNNQAINEFLTPLLALPRGKITHADLTTQLGAAEASGFVTQPAIAALIQAGPSGDGPAFDANVRAHVASQAQNNPAQAVAEVTPSQEMITAAGPNGVNVIQPVNIAPAGSENVGQVTPVGNSFATGMSAGEAAQPTTIPTTAGSTTMPLGQYAKNALGTGASSSKGSGSTPPPSAPSWNGFQYPDWAVHPSTTIPAGVAAEQQTGENLYNADTTAVANFGKVINNLQNIKAEGDAAGTGPLSDALKELGASASELGITNGQQATDLQLLQKNVAQVVTSQLNGLGIPTDAKMDEVSFGTPNGQMTNDARDGAVGQIIGGLKWKEAETNAFNAYTQAAAAKGIPVSSAAYGQFASQWQQRVPVAAFQLPLLPPQQQAKYWNSLSKTDKYQIYQVMQNPNQFGIQPAQQ